VLLNSDWMGGIIYYFPTRKMGGRMVGYPTYYQPEFIYKIRKDALIMKNIGGLADFVTEIRNQLQSQAAQQISSIG
jgi:hypothetical protein